MQPIPDEGCVHAPRVPPVRRFVFGNDMKICSKCNINKPLKEFWKESKSKDGYRSWCKSCCRKSFYIWRKNNPKKHRKIQNKWIRNNYQTIKILRKKYKNPEKHKIYDQKWRSENKEKCKEYYKKHRKNRLLKISKNPSLLAIFKLSQNIKAAIRHSLKKNKNGRHWETLVGYTLLDLKKHLESQFKDGMNWENRGQFGWHIDHIIPQSKFHFKTAEDVGFKTCWGLNNLQPLWWRDNIIKGNKIMPARLGEDVIL